ncbi:hypothetical protein BTEBP_320012 [Brochothrix thermosphacta]|nr:hypothetical protein BTEBP_320012 [Brochothrix thermosphacta]
MYDVIISVGNIVTHENDFTVESFENVVNAHDAATTVYDNKNATQAEVDQVKTDLQSAIEALEKAVVVDKADLYDVIISVGNIVTHENDFTVESFDNMGNAFDVATTVYDNKNATQAEVDQAKTDSSSTDSSSTDSSSTDSSSNFKNKNSSLPITGEKQSVVWYHLLGVILIIVAGSIFINERKNKRS